ncbi:MAG: ABC transporter substrate-binding protein [Firmicutes bacterium]|nr:ABC transporter substrate-binding protein [Bacillota bacterium]
MNNRVLAISGAVVLMSTITACGNTTKTSNAPVPPFVTIGTIMPPGAPMNIFSSSFIVRPGMDIMPLAVSHNSSNLGAFYPALASHWQVSNKGRTVTVWLRSNARWSNGKPVTAADVVTTMACSYAVGIMQADGLGTARVLGPKEVQLTLAPGITSNTFLLDVLTTDIVPRSVFGSLLPANIWNIIHTAQYAGSNAGLKAKAQTAASELTKLGTTIASFAPAHDVASGPFVIQSVNPGEMIMRKNPYFFAAQNVPVNEVIVRNYTGSQEVWNYAISGQVDELTGNLPVNIYNQAKKTPGNVFYKVPAYTMTALAFNEHTYPYNLTAVRQAMAYIINRQAVQHVANPISASASRWTDGMVDAATQQWLTPSEIRALNPYTVNYAKATSLLQSAGFHKVGSQWMLPNGKPWTATLTTVSSFSSWMAMAESVRSTMDRFGVPTKVVGMTFAQELLAQAQGTLPLSFWIDGQGPNPYFAYNRIYGKPDGYVIKNGKLVRNAAGNPSGGNWIDFPTTVQVPGYGTVNPGQLTQQLNQTTTTSTIQRDTRILAKVTNEYVPQITMWNVAQTGWVNTKHFTDYPLKNRALMVATEGYYPPVGIWMMLHYIRPVS